MMTDFENHMIPMVNDKHCYLDDTYGIFPNTEWGMCVLVAAADLKKHGLDYRDSKQTLDHAFHIWFQQTIENCQFSDGFDLVDRDKLKKSDEHYFVKQYLLRHWDIYYREVINGIVTYERIFGVSLKYSAYYVAGLLIDVCESEIDELIKLNYTDMSGCTDLR